MISVTELRAGRTFRFENEPYQVLEYRHTKLGRGTANIRVKVQNLRSGAIVEKTFISGAKVEPIETEVKFLQYLYQEGDNFYFMEPKTFEQFSLSRAALGPKAKFLQEGKEIKVLFWEKKPLMVELPNSLVFKVIQAPPGVKGNSATASYKPVTLDNHLVVKVPLFIKVGDKIKVDTRTGEYIGRVKE